MVSSWLEYQQWGGDVKGKKKDKQEGVEEGRGKV